MIKNLQSDLHMLIKARRLYLSRQLETKVLDDMITDTLDLIIQGGIK